MMLMLVTSCATSTGSLNFCDGYRIVPTLDVGTEKQKLTVDQNNAVYDRYCTS